MKSEHDKNESISARFMRVGLVPAICRIGLHRRIGESNRFYEMPMVLLQGSSTLKNTSFLSYITRNISIYIVKEDDRVYIVFFPITHMKAMSVLRNVILAAFNKNRKSSLINTLY